MKYTDFTKEIQAKIDAFPFMFAFSNQQLEEGKQKLGVTDNSELLSIGSVGYIRKTDREAYKNMMNEVYKAKEDYLKDPKQLKDAFLYELLNHEYSYTRDLDPTLESLGLDFNTLTKEQQFILADAEGEYITDFYKREEEEDARQEALATA